MQNLKSNHPNVRPNGRVLSSVFAVLALALGLTACDNAESNLTIEQSSFDFGYAPQKSKLTHVFWLTSPGTALLKIAKVVPG